MSKGYRCRVNCQNCGVNYITNKKHNPDKPARCKHCGSRRLRLVNRWEVQ